MRIVVIGDGKVGRTIVSHLASEGHTVVVIDKNPDVIEQIVEQYDVMGICGNGAIYDIQKSAKVDKADLVIAATSSDEINVLSCVIAKQLGAKATVARVRSYEYDEQNIPCPYSSWITCKLSNYTHPFPNASFQSNP